MPIERTTEAKVNIKPVGINLIHSAAYEGPCRVGEKDELTPEADRKKEQETFQKFADSLESIGPMANVAEPSCIEWTDSFVLPESELDRLSPDAHEADLILINPTNLPQYPAVRIAERFDKPVAMIGQVSSVDITAYLRARDREGYAFLNYDELNAFLRLMRVWKALSKMRMMVAIKENILSVGVVSSISDLDGLWERYGVDRQLITMGEVMEPFRGMEGEPLQQARQLSEELIANATDCDMTVEQLLPSAQFYVSVRGALDRYDANAFVVPCFEPCATQMMEKHKLVFCLTHSLLKDDGIPGACEGDINALLAMSVLMNLAKKSAHMGNASVQDADENIIRVHHDVPGLKMTGFDEPDLPYGIKNFTVGGWGGTIRCDLSDYEGQPATIARFNPQGTALLTTRGEIAGTSGYMDVGCALAYQLKVADARGWFEKSQEFGHHFALVLGDYVDKLERLGDIAGFDVIVA